MVDFLLISMSKFLTSCAQIRRGRHRGMSQPAPVAEVAGVGTSPKVCERASSWASDLFFDCDKTDLPRTAIDVSAVSSATGDRCVFGHKNVVPLGVKHITTSTTKHIQIEENACNIPMNDTPNSHAGIRMCLHKLEMMEGASELDKLKQNQLAAA